MNVAKKVIAVIVFIGASAAAQADSVSDARESLLISRMAVPEYVMAIESLASTVFIPGTIEYEGEVLVQDLFRVEMMQMFLDFSDSEKSDFIDILVDSSEYQEDVVTYRALAASGNTASILVDWKLVLHNLSALYGITSDYESPYFK